MALISASRVLTTSFSGTFRRISPLRNKIAHPSPPAMPISASLASPGPFTAQPMTATFTGLRQSASAASTSFASAIKLIRVLPQVGQEIISAPVLRISAAFRISYPALTSSTGSAVSETRIVSPMPSTKRLPMPMAFLITPIRAVPASVTPRCSGYFAFFSK